MWSDASRILTNGSSWGVLSYSDNICVYVDVFLYIFSKGGARRPCEPLLNRSLGMGPAAPPVGKIFSPLPRSPAGGLPFPPLPSGWILPPLLSGWFSLSSPALQREVLLLPFPRLSVVSVGWRSRT